jgi:hypothetical protein
MTAREMNIGPAALVGVVEPGNVRHQYIAAIWKAGVDVGMPTLIGVSLKPPRLKSLEVWGVIYTSGPPLRGALR